MVDDAEVTLWLHKLARGDELAAQKIWEQYCQKLFAVARRKLGELPRRAADEEDVVLSAFHSFCRGVAAGRFPQLADRSELRRLLVTITARKAVAQIRRANYQKRGGGAVRGESVFFNKESSEDGAGLDQVLGTEPSPDFAAAVEEQCALLLDRLDDDSLRSVALWKLEGYKNEEIAEKLNCALTTVERKLARIRKRWGQEIEL